MESKPTYYLLQRTNGKKWHAIAGTNYGGCIAGAQAAFRAAGFTVDDYDAVYLASYAENLKSFNGLAPDYRSRVITVDDIFAHEARERMEFAKKLIQLERPLAYLVETFPNHKTELETLFSTNNR